MMTFEIDVDQNAGVAIVAAVDRLTAACLSPDLIDAHVSELKRELDEVALRAKLATLTLQTLP